MTLRGGVRFENLVASHLYKRIPFLEDLTGDRYEFCYIRDQRGHEVDFIVLKNNKPTTLIEAKLSDKVRSKSFYYFRERLKIHSCIQLVMDLESSSTKDDILVTSAHKWLSQHVENLLF